MFLPLNSPCALSSCITICRITDSHQEDIKLLVMILKASLLALGLLLASVHARSIPPNLQPFYNTVKVSQTILLFDDTNI